MWRKTIDPSDKRPRIENGFLAEECLPDFCPQCVKEGWPKPNLDQILGDGEKFARGKIPDALKRPPVPSGPMWGSKLGSLKAPCSSAFCGPDDLSGNVAMWWEDCRPAGAGIAGFNMLIDARGRILVPGMGGIDAWGLEGRVRFTIHPNKTAIANTPALVGSLLYVAETDGNLVCYDLSPDPPVLKWRKQFCTAMGVDPSALAANEDIVISAGMDAPPMEGVAVQFSSHVYAMDARTGNLRWKVKMPMPSLMIVPSIAGDCAIYMASSGAIDCIALKDGKPKWQAKGEMGSMSTGGAVVYGQTVVATLNRRAKKAPNAPFGGKGAARAFSLADGKQLWEQLFDLEANTLPAVTDKGPGGKAAVIVCLGASPGAPEGKPNGKVLGDHWDGRVVALSVQTGEIFWSFELLPWTAPACAGHVFWEQGSLASPPPGWTVPTVGDDGNIYVNWNTNGTLYVLSGPTGTELSKLYFGHPMASAPVIAPGILWIQFMVKGLACIAQTKPAFAKELRPLELPFTGPSGSGTDHFWPMKHNDPLALGMSKFRAPRDLSNPAWVFKTPLKLLDCWYGNSPIMDAQRNVYMGGNWSDLFIIRPDGTLRGSLYCGPYYSTPALHKEFLYVADSMGIMRCFNIETLELKWSVRYTGTTQSDNYSLAIHEGSIIAPGNEFWPVDGPAARYGCGKPYYQSGHKLAYRLSCETGETIWKLDFRAFTPNYPNVLWNFTPCVFEDYVVFMDMQLGAYCCKFSTGEFCWRIEPSGRMSTGNQCSAANGLMYWTGNKGILESDPEDFKPHWNNHEGPGIVKCARIRTGEIVWERMCQDSRGFWLGCNQGPLFVPGRHGARDIVAVPFSSNIGGAPTDKSGIAIGDAWTGKLAAFDAESGEPVWDTQWEMWHHSHVAGGFFDDPGFVWPDSWGGLSVDSSGIIYAHWMDGKIHAVNSVDGEVLSSYDTGNSSNAQILLAPGMAVFTGGFGIFCFRDADLEEEWLEEAREQDDPRAKAPLMDIPEPKDDPKPREPWMLWRGPVYAEEQNFREGDAWIEEFTKVHKAYIEINEEWSKKKSAAGPPKTSAPAAAAKKKSASGAAAPAPAAAPAANGKSGAGAQWVVVGGGEKGIVVRSGKDLKSDEVGRLDKGAKIEQVKKDGERVQFKKVSGGGPDVGWVSLTFKGAPLIQPA